ncbi:hypothetical protein B0H13DRAFT_2318784 [Mycena leptocephala]|nr:hypothetical protein B0H13DRAFT_2318784 [Mycena leptocephala]
MRPFSYAPHLAPHHLQSPTQNLRMELVPFIDPRFPRELERIIFEIAAHAHTTSIPTLLLAAVRVKDWLEPLLYRVVLVCATPPTKNWPFPRNINADVLLRVIANRPAGYLQRVVGHLFLDKSVTFTQAETILQATC